MARITRATNGVMVWVRRDALGGVTVKPNCKALRAALKERGEDPDLRKHGAYLQGDAADQFLADDVSPRSRASINSGYSTSCFINDELAYCLLGIAY